MLVGLQLRLSVNCLWVVASVLINVACGEIEKPAVETEIYESENGIDFIVGDVPDALSQHVLFHDWKFRCSPDALVKVESDGTLHIGEDYYGVDLSPWPYDIERSEEITFHNALLLVRSMGSSRINQEVDDYVKLWFNVPFLSTDVGRKHRNHAILSSDSKSLLTVDYEESSALGWIWLDPNGGPDLYVFAQWRDDDFKSLEMAILPILSSAETVTSVVGDHGGTDRVPESVGTEQGGADRPATAPESAPEGDEQPKPEPEARSQ